MSIDRPHRQRRVNWRNCSRWSTRSSQRCFKGVPVEPENLCDVFEIIRGVTLTAQTADNTSSRGDRGQLLLPQAHEHTLALADYVRDHRSRVPKCPECA